MRDTSTSQILCLLLNNHEFESNFVFASGLVELDEVRTYFYF